MLVLGGGICGLATAMLLARDGHTVRVLERDSEEAPGSVEEAWGTWDRGGVAQFRQTHHLQPRVRQLLEAELPEVLDGLTRNGAYRRDMIANLPPMIGDRQPRDGDDRFWTLTARRSTAEFVVASLAREEPRLTIDRGVRVVGVLSGTPVIDGVPHVVGAVTRDGGQFRAELVVDAMGRRSTFGDWCQSAGGEPPMEKAEDWGFTYYTVYFTGELPEFRGPAIMEFGSISILTLPADNNVWAVTVWCSSRDQPLKELRHLDTFRRVVALSPLQAHWLEAEAITGVLPFSGAVDRYRRFLVAGRPVMTGMVAVADAWACTNPSAGRGISLGLSHAVRLRDTLRDTAGNPAQLARDLDEITETELTPWYEDQVRRDRNRYRTMDALRQGHPPPPLPAAADDDSRLERLFWQAMPFDPDLFRAGVEVMSVLTLTRDVLKRPGMRERVEAVAQQLPTDAPAMPGPTRADLLTALAS